MKVLIGGGSGFIGRHLSRLLRENGCQPIIVSRKAVSGDMTWEELTEKGLPENCKAVVNLAGANILNPLRRWTDEFKEEICESRIGTTSVLVRAIRGAKVKPQVYVALTGVAYYRPSETEEYTEESDGGDYDFLSRLVTQWEAASAKLDDIGVRRVLVRSGVVLGRHGGVIKNMYIPFFLGLGGRIGSGTQWFPWIHVDDITGIITNAIINSEVKGILNGTAPELCTNAEFTQTFARSMFRFAILPMPAFAVSLLLGNERAKVMLEGQKVVPKRTMEYEYKYLYPTLKEACMAI